MKGADMRLFSSVRKGLDMRRILWVVFGVVCATFIGGTSFDVGRAEQTFGPRAVYSPFQGMARDSETKGQGLAPFAAVWQDTVEEVKPKIEEIKKPGRAFFMSALVPGLGQWYAGAKTRAAVFFGIETACAVYALMANGDGNDWEKKYEAFADDHWIVERYNDKRYDSDQDVEVPPSNASWFGWWEEWYTAWALDPLENELTHRLPEIKDEDGVFRGWEKDHDYYEMIGKYNQFVYGWDDVNDLLLPGDSTLAPDHDILIWSETGLDTANFDPYIADVKSSHREEYMDMRHEANKAFKRAKTMVGVILFNHVVSAIDAARSARNYNLKQAENKTSLRMRMKKYEGEYIPQLVFTHKFY